MVNNKVNNKNNKNNKITKITKITNKKMSYSSQEKEHIITETNLIQNIDNTSIAIGLFILTISSNYIGELLGCKVQNLLTNNILVKHIAGFMCLFFFITHLTPFQVVEDDGTVRKEKVGMTAIRTLGIYIFYIITSKTRWEFTLSAYSIIFIIYILYLIQQDYYMENEEITLLINDFKYGLAVVAVLIIVVGFGLYLNQKYVEYGVKKCDKKYNKECFSIKKFLLGNARCKND